MDLQLGYGVLAKLPYELRRLIWLEFLPVTKDASSSTSKISASADLRILRTSRTLYNEISDIIYSKSQLHFDLSPDASDNHSFWCGLSFRPGPYLNNRAKSNANGAEWRLETGSSGKDARFNNFPFNKIDAIKVSLLTPDPEVPLQLYWLWRNVIRTVELFADAQLSKPALVIKLVEHEKWDWNNLGRVFDIGEVREGQWRSRPRWQYVYDTLLLPFFYALRGLELISIDPPESLEDKADWRYLNLAGTVVSRRVMTAGRADPLLGVAERELWDRVLRDYFWMHDILFRQYFLEKFRTEYMREEWGHNDQLLKVIEPHPSVY